MNSFFSEEVAKDSPMEYNQNDKVLPYRVIKRMGKGKELVGMEYEQFCHGLNLKKVRLELLEEIL